MGSVREPAAILRVFILTSMVGVGLISFADALNGFSKNFPVSVAMLVVFLGCFLVGLSPRRYRFAVHLFSVTIIIAISYNFLCGIGIHDPASPVYLLGILIPAFFLGKKVVPGYSALVFLASNLVIALDVLRVVPSGYPSTWGTSVTFSVVAALGGILIWLLLDQLDRSLRDGQQAVFQVRQLNEDLENRVADRTKSLSEAHERLSQNDRLTALGTVASNLTHEINTPLGALVSGSSSLEQNLDRFRGSIARLTVVGSGPDMELFRELAFQTPVRPDPVVRKNLKNLGARLEALGSPDGLDLAGCLAEIGFGDTQAVEDLLGGRRLTPGVEAAIRAADEFLVLGRLASIVGESADRVHQIVESLKTHINSPGESEEFTRFCLNDSLGSAVETLRAGLARGVTVEIDCPPDSWILGQRDRLFLVWTNLFRESVLSVPPGGEIFIRCRRDPGEENWRIEFEDTGIPGPLGGEQPWRLFVQRVLTRHGGTFSSIENPGSRVVRMTLPTWDL